MNGQVGLQIGRRHMQHIILNDSTVTPFTFGKRAEVLRTGFSYAIRHTTRSNNLPKGQVFEDHHCQRI